MTFGSRLERSRRCAATDSHPGASALPPDCRCARPALLRSGNALQRASERLPPGRPKADREAPVLTASLLLLRHAASVAVGAFEPAIFRLHADEDLALWLRPEAGPLMFTVGVYAVHDGASSARRLPASRTSLAFHTGRSRVYSTRLHDLPCARHALASALGQTATAPAQLFASKCAKQAVLLCGVVSALIQGTQG